MLIFVISLVIFRYNRTAELFVGGFGALFYIAWGIIHHALEDRLSKEVVMEYVLFGTLAFLMLVFALNI
jgi:hypothetical protein